MLKSSTELLFDFDGTKYLSCGNNFQDIEGKLKSPLTIIKSSGLAVETTDLIAPPCLSYNDCGEFGGMYEHVINKFLCFSLIKTAINSMPGKESTINPSDGKEQDTAIRTPPPFFEVTRSFLKIIYLFDSISEFKIVLLSQVSVKAST